MGLMDRIKKVTGTNDGFDEAYEDDYYDGFDNYDDGMDDADVQTAAMQQPAGMNTIGIGSAPVSGAAPTGGISFSGSNIKMQVVRPQNYDSETCAQIANHLLNKCTVVLNLESTSKETSRRLIDFLLGVAFSIGGSLKKIATNAYVITPSNVDVGEPELKRAKRAEAQPEVKETAVDEFADFD